MQLPPNLVHALDAALEHLPPKDVAAAVRDLSQRYRGDYARATSRFLGSELDVFAYAAYRLPATFGAVTSALRQLQEVRPDLNPRRVLDLGAGPGTAAWAATELWPEIEQICIAERDARMVRLGQSLAMHAVSPALRSAEWRQADLTTEGQSDRADLAIMAYVLGELPEESRDDVVHRLWAGAADVALIVEPGTPRGFDLVRRAGDVLVGEGAHIAAPFPWSWRCVEHERDWCHFAARVPRTRTHRTAKGGALAYEDEKFFYVAASRTPSRPIAARVIRHPQIRRGHIRLTLCIAGGVSEVVVARSHREAFRRAKDLGWGSAIMPEEAALFGIEYR